MLFLALLPYHSWGFVCDGSFARSFSIFFSFTSNDVLLCFIMFTIPDPLVFFYFYVTIVVGFFIDKIRSLLASIVDLH